MQVFRAIWAWMHSNKGKVVVVALSGAIVAYCTGEINATGLALAILNALLPGVGGPAAGSSAKASGVTINSFWLWVLVLPLLSGCVGEIDDAIYKVDQDQATAWRLTKVALDKGIEGYGQTEESRSALQKNEINRRVQDLMNRHTGRDGRLYASTQPGDPATPMLAADILQMMQDRDTLVLQAALTHQQNAKNIALLQEAIARYDAAIELLADKKADWMTKRRTAAAAVNAAITALTSSGTVAGIIAIAGGL